MTDNVTPITETHVCASCKAEIDTRHVFEGHTEQCMQPEVRMRRLERMALEHRMVIGNLSELLRAEIENSASMSRTLETLATAQGELVEALGRLAERVKGPSMTRPFCGYPRADGIEDIPKDAFHGSSKEPTQRSEHADDAERYLTARRRDPIDPGEPHANTSAAEPADAQAAGAEPGGAEPERAS